MRMTPENGTKKEPNKKARLYFISIFLRLFSPSRTIPGFSPFTDAKTFIFRIVNRMYTDTPRC